ncbi:MAG: hypothetical protein AAFW65_00875 [Pseudomonadota bacterium]
MRGLLYLCALFFAVSQPAESEDANTAIVTFNSAREAGDPQVMLSAARGLAAAAIANPERSNAALLGFEAGLTLCLVNDCEGALEVAEFAVSLTPSSNLPPIDHRVALLALTRYSKRETRNTRKALDEALTPLIDSDPSLLSVLAFSRRLADAVAAGKWRQAAKSASEAAAHFEKLQDVRPDLLASARMTEITAAFNQSPKPSQILSMARFEATYGAMRRDIHSSNEESPSWLDDAYFSAFAWRLAMTSYFDSSSRKRPTDEEIEDIIGDDVSPSAEQTVAPGALPACAGRPNYRPKLRYPTGQAFRGRIGAVVVRFKVRDSKIVEPEVLAAVPHEGFKESVLETMLKWKWELDDDQPVRPCSPDHDNVLIPYVFSLR